MSSIPAINDEPDGTVVSPLTSGITLSPEQTAIAMHVDAGQGNILVVARAGTGKTFLIRQCLPLMRGPVAICAFNSKIVKEVAAKVSQDGNRADIATFHSFGWRALRGVYPKAKLEGKGAGKAGEFKFDLIADKLEIADFMRGFVKKAMSLAMQSGFGIFFPLNDKDRWLTLVDHYDLDLVFGDDNIGLQMQPGKTVEEKRQKLVHMGCSLAAKGVKLGIQMVHEIVSFDDMIYAPLVLNVPLPQFRWVCVDEAQDSNPVRREMAKRMTMPGGRMFFVGDNKQAIYGFSGADNDALDTIGKEFACARFPMTVTRRCSKLVVALARGLVPDFQAHEDNAEGEVLAIAETDFAGQTFRPGHDAVICRFTAPLVKAAYSLIGAGVPAHVEGKDIGRGLLALIDKWPHITKPADLLKKLDEHLDKETTKLLAKKKEAAADALADAVDTIKVIAKTLPPTATVDTLRNDISSLFADAADGQRVPTVAFMTAHRSKGLEFDRVWGLGVRSHFPARFARQPWQLAQEENLRYVLYTRAITTYVDVVL